VDSVFASTDFRTTGSVRDEEVESYARGEDYETGGEDATPFAIAEERHSRRLVRTVVFFGVATVG